MAPRHLVRIQSTFMYIQLYPTLLCHPTKGKQRLTMTERSASCNISGERVPNVPRILVPSGRFYLFFGVSSKFY